MDPPVQGAGQCLGLGVVFEAPAFVSGIDDVAMMGQAVEQSGGHFGIAEDAGPFASSNSSVSGSLT